VLYYAGIERGSFKKLMKSDLSSNYRDILEELTGDSGNTDRLMNRRIWLLNTSGSIASM
jgi:hypothetical protein